MIHDTIRQLEAGLQSNQIPEGKRAELVALLATLRAEVQSLDSTHPEQARSIAGFTHISTHEATRLEKNPGALAHALAGLRSSVAGFEQSNPRLVQAVNSVCTALANLGI
ncbi:MAG: DUF4404 family protein [Verrucomicrobiota bacterium]